MRDPSTLRSAPLTARASRSRSSQGSSGLGPAPIGPRPHRAPPPTCPGVFPQWPGDLRHPRVGNDSAAPPAIPRALCIPARPAPCFQAVRRCACCRPEATLDPVPHVLAAPPAALLLPSAFHPGSAGHPPGPSIKRNPK